jgi:riboflavin synthase
VFTGIVETIGMVRAAHADGEAVRLSIQVPGGREGTKAGDSIAVSGVCLTVTRMDNRVFDADVTTETLARTTLGGLRAGDVVNLEWPLALGERLGGHIVQGHVDGAGRVACRDAQGASLRLEIEAPPPLARYIVEKGSIAVDGVSLTVAAVNGDRFTVCLIPHTCAVTTLGALAPGARVNLEVDIMAKYVERLLAAYVPGADAPPAGVAGGAVTAGRDRAAASREEQR